MINGFVSLRISREARQTIKQLNLQADPMVADLAPLICTSPQDLRLREGFFDFLKGYKEGVGEKATGNGMSLGDGVEFSLWMGKSILERDLRVKVQKRGRKSGC
ncbi:hypothetical protein L596_029885 [Steinernema carpocapsae]|uniref:Uncharacterized protein n=1 Tax=Steinernema carpocapsae TaxID=34508 RepID=A0A4U5LR26_STECR|nr:hypothetical protein L596_029885 [Steinernema carpocapsae]